MEKLPNAEKARQLSLKNSLKQLDQYVNEAIANGELERRFDISSWHAGDQILIDNIDKVIHHFHEQHYQVEYGRSDDESTYEVPYDKREHPVMYWLGMKEIKTKVYKGYWIIVKW